MYSWILWICKDTKLQRSFFFYLASWILRSISPFKSYRIEISLRAPILFNAFFKGLTLGFFIMALLFYFIYYLMPWLIEPIETSIRFLSILNTLFSNKEIASPVRAKLSSPRRSCLTLSVWHIGCHSDRSDSGVKNLNWWRKCHAGFSPVSHPNF